MITRLIAETLTPIVSKSRFLKLSKARAVVSNHPYLDLDAPTRHGCRTTLVVKQGVQKLPLYRRAYMGYLHVDFKTHNPKQARRKVHEFLKLQCIGQFTSWGYGALRWMQQKTYSTKLSTRPWGPRFQIRKGLPPNLTAHERQLVMAALLHDLVDTTLHPSKLGPPVTIPNPYVRWLCEQHHNLKEYPDNPDLQLIHAADVRTSRYARPLPVPTRRRQMAPVNTSLLAHELELAVQCSVYKLYSAIYLSQDLYNLTASKAHPTETLRNHLIGVANWVLFLRRHHPFTYSSA